jgi:fused signal recognition particle receptor
LSSACHGTPAATVHRRRRSREARSENAEALLIESPLPAGYRPRDDATRDVLSISKKANDSGARASWFRRLRQGLGKTGAQLSGLFRGAKVDEALFEELETALLGADAGIDATEHLLAAVRARVKRERIESPAALQQALASELESLLAPLETVVETDTAKPFVIMMVGVNGAGKTTSIGKLANYLRGRERSVVLAAGDTFRAAAREQLVEWGARNGVDVIAQQGGDPAAVIFDAIHAAHARGADVLIADTAGRLPTQLHLMEELKKVKRVVAKAEPGAPHAIWLVLDANTGQNALNQVKAFDDALGLTGLVMTKLDGTARGGVIAAIARTRPIPVAFIGVGEGIDDLRPFVAHDFAQALLGEPGGAPAEA